MDNLYLDEFINLCKKRDRSAQQTIYTQFYPVVYRICLRYSKDSSEAKDMTQEAFIKIFLKIHQYKGKGSFEGWLKRVAVTTAINSYNKNKKYINFTTIDEQQMQDDIAGEETLNQGSGKDIYETSGLKLEDIGIDIVRSANFDYDELLEVLKLIPEPFRIVFNLFIIEEYTHEDISRELNINIKTSWSRLSRAKQMFQKKLGELTLKRLRV